MERANKGRIKLRIYRRNLRARKAFSGLIKMKLDLTFPKADVLNNHSQVLLQET